MRPPLLSSATFEHRGKLILKIIVRESGTGGNQCPDWRSTFRPAILRRATLATTGLDWCSALFRTLLKNLRENDGLEALLGPMQKNLPVAAYPQVIALALILRHSWGASGLAADPRDPGSNRLQERSERGARASRAI